MRNPRALIHLEALAHNIGEIRRLTGDVPLMGVVKANAYGHGAVPVTRTLQECGLSFFAVFTIEEALELRQAGIADPILIFSRTDPQWYQTAVEQDLHLNVCTPLDLPAIREFAGRRKTTPCFHLKLDTGMTRLGCSPEEALEVVRLARENPSIRLEGLYSHYATADEGDLTYAHRQHRVFQEFLDRAREEGQNFRYIHFSNSGAVLNLPESYYNLIRVGMLMYGAYPSQEVEPKLDLRPVMEFRGTIVSVRRVPAGTAVSYGGVYVTATRSTIGVIQAGFADGFPRPWYERGEVVYHGQRYRIAGRVCMDQFMVDFGETEPVIGEEVLLFGAGEDGLLTVDEIAARTGLTTYMLLTAIGGRTQREFVP